MEYLSVTELKDNMRILMDQVASDERLIVNKNGKPVARIKSFEAEAEQKKNTFPKVKG